ncbi:MAG: hypothetical protein CVT92_04875 [Bacteroidetes bacterium HGW-Bacteroidetes-1]|jgi:VIT1/CCC1 family predicted Fe2+/Mn2+ transporter|nr:MAG: hypothetical protein CVT92_04875 [Bacteroidetes bacterium HGW-Bacteroidetes-1]
MESEKHFINRSGWLRASILGANDGIISTASIIIGVAAASDVRDPIVLAGVAGLVAGALSMAAGEYVSVSSQSDLERSDILREKKELENDPEQEIIELAEIYETRGLEKGLSMQVAKQLSAHNALKAHARDELGLNEMTKAKPLQAALSSGIAFIFGGLLPVIVSLLASVQQMIYLQYIFALLFLIVMATVAAKIGGSSVSKSILRITFWGTMAMAITALIGYLFGISAV